MTDLHEVLGRLQKADELDPLRISMGRNPPPTDAEIASLERDLGAFLPSDFKEAVRTIGTGDIGYAWIYGVRPGEEPTLVSINQSGLQPIRDFVAFSDDGTGNYYGYEIETGRARDEVTLIDHESGAREVVFDSIASWLASKAFLEGRE